MTVVLAPAGSPSSANALLLAAGVLLPGGDCVVLIWVFPSRSAVIAVIISTPAERVSDIAVCHDPASPGTHAGGGFSSA